jgi:hypothetical protein
MMWNQARRRGAFALTVRTVLPIAVALAVGSASYAGEGKWILRFEPMFVEAYGHDQHVLTVHEIDFDSTPQLNSKTATTLDTDSSLAYRVEFQYAGNKWLWGVDVFWFDSSQSAPDRTAAADGPAGTLDEVVFMVAGRDFTSSDPSEVLYYGVLEDTDLAAWTVDLYGMRTLAEKSESDVRLQLGLRLGDFDNDYRAVAGVQDIGGTRFEASSNYERMMGPLVGLAGGVHRGKNYIEGYIGQSLLIGSAALSSRNTEFTGPFSSPTFFAQETFETDQDVAIPVTEFRIGWTYEISKRFSLGAGANASAWWDVSVPPGVIPAEDGDEVLHENTIVFYGVLAAMEYTF